MTDLEELFRPLIEESARHREPVATIEARVRDRRVRRRRLRAQYRFGGAFLAVALIATAVGVVHARGDRSPARPSRVATTTPPTPTTLAPAGWSTYDYGLARISIPTGWTAGTGCPAPRVLVMTDPTNDDLGCGAGGTPSIDIGPIERSFVFHPNDPALSVNGIPYEVGAPSCFGGASDPCPTLVWAPRLGVELSFDGVDYHTVMQTLTFSTYARLLQQPFGPVPASWKTVTFNGFSVRVPADWPTVDLSKRGFCYPASNTVYVGTPAIVEQCLVRPIEPRESSLQLESTDVSSPPPQPTGWHHNGLRFTQRIDSASLPLSTELFLAVDGPHGRLLVTLGLGLDFTVARGILGSITVAGRP